MVLIHLLEERLRAVLSDIPLQHAKADSLVIEVAGQSRETIRRRMVGFESAGERETGAPILTRIPVSSEPKIGSRCV